ncbi:MAG: hypothetical protein IKW74_04430 [Thermoguttaceae bacterium]|nr:hypothetical protein [Thermoguttaceae bacterium]
MPNRLTVTIIYHFVFNKEHLPRPLRDVYQAELSQSRNCRIPSGKTAVVINERSGTDGNPTGCDGLY